MSNQALTVHVNRDGPGSVDTDRSDAEGGTIETRGTFDVLLSNHGNPVHVHLRVEGDLADVVSIEPPNHYLEAESELVLEVAVARIDEPVSGTLQFSTRFGAEIERVPITVTPGPPPVEVDESLARPPEPDPEPTGIATVRRTVSETKPIPIGTVAVVVLAIGALVLGIAIAVTVNAFAAVLGLVAVTGAVAVAISLLWWDGR